MLFIPGETKLPDGTEYEGALVELDETDFVRATSDSVTVRTRI